MLNFSIFFPLDQKNLVGPESTWVEGGLASYLLIYCGSKVSLGQGPSPVCTHKSRLTKEGRFFLQKFFKNQLHVCSNFKFTQKMKRKIKDSFKKLPPTLENKKYQTTWLLTEVAMA